MSAGRLRLWTAFAIVSTVWGSTWMAIKIGLHSIPPFFAAGMRFALAAAVLFVIVKLRRVEVPNTTGTRKLFLSLSILSYTIPFALVYWGQQYIPSGLSSILFAAFPFWVALFSHFILADERASLAKIAGIVFGFVGLVIVFSGNLTWMDSRGVLGMLAVLISTILQGYALVLTKRYAQPISPFALNLVCMSIGAVGLLLISSVSESYSDIVWDAAAIGSIVYLALAGSVLTFVSYHWLLKRVEAVYLSLTSFINPIVAVVLGAVILGESLPPTVFAGAAFVLFGILIANARGLLRRAARFQESEG